MSCDEKTVTEREAVMRERAAFKRGARMYRAELTDATVIERSVAEYPLPKVTRPRVVRDPHFGFTQTWRVRDGWIEWRDPDFKTEWKVFEPEGFGSDDPRSCLQVTTKRIALWADLLATPTEEVAADD